MSDALSIDRTSDDQVELIQYDPATANLGEMIDLWQTLQNSTAEAALAPKPSIFDFQQTCLLFATIQGPIYRVFESIRQSDEPNSGDGGESAADTNADENSRQTPSSLIVERYAIAGFLYIMTSGTPSEAVIGLVISPQARRHGLGTIATRKALELVFEHFAFHRASATLVVPPKCDATSGRTRLHREAEEETERALRMLINLGFSHEGTRRSAIPSPGDTTWRDVHHLGILEMDYFNRKHHPQSTLRTRWDEMLTRHQSELEILASVESRLSRSHSTETLRPSEPHEESMLMAADSCTESSSVTGEETDTSANNIYTNLLGIRERGQRAVFSLESDSETDEETQSSEVRARIERYLNEVEMLPLSPYPTPANNVITNPFADSNQDVAHPLSNRATSEPLSTDSEHDWSEADVSDQGTDSETETEQEEEEMRPLWRRRSRPVGQTQSTLGIRMASASDAPISVSLPTPPKRQRLTEDDSGPSVLPSSPVQSDNPSSEGHPEYNLINSRTGTDTEEIREEIDAIASGMESDDLSSSSSTWDVINDHEDSSFEDI